MSSVQQRNFLILNYTFEALTYITWAAIQRSETIDQHLVFIKILHSLVSWSPKETWEKFEQPKFILRLPSWSICIFPTCSTALHSWFRYSQLVVRLWFRITILRWCWLIAFCGFRFLRCSGGFGLTGCRFWRGSFLLISRLFLFCRFLFNLGFWFRNPINTRNLHKERLSVIPTTWTCSCWQVCITAYGYMMLYKNTNLIL